MLQVRIDLDFAGAILPVTTDDAGREVVPVKPIVEAIGLDWMRQYRRMQTPWMTRRLGVCVGHMPYAGQTREMVCIRLDRVAAYLNTISPESVRAANNEDAADFLERKHEEWDQLIHEYELRQGMFATQQQQVQSTRIQSMRTLIAANRELRATEDERGRKTLQGMVATLAKDSGLPYQVDILDDSEAG